MWCGVFVRNFCDMCYHILGFVLPATRTFPPFPLLWFFQRSYDSCRQQYQKTQSYRNWYLQKNKTAYVWQVCYIGLDSERLYSPERNSNFTISTCFPQSTLWKTVLLASIRNHQSDNFTKTMKFTINYIEHPPKKNDARNPNLYQSQLFHDVKIRWCGLHCFFVFRTSHQKVHLLGRP